MTSAGGCGGLGHYAVKLNLILARPVECGGLQQLAATAPKLPGTEAFFRKTLLSIRSRRMVQMWIHAPGGQRIQGRQAAGVCRTHAAGVSGAVLLDRQDAQNLRAGIPIHAFRSFLFEWSASQFSVAIYRPDGSATVEGH